MNPTFVTLIFEMSYSQVDTWVVEMRRGREGEIGEDDDGRGRELVIAWP
jgi:hypothetical protein